MYKIQLHNRGNFSLIRSNFCANQVKSQDGSQIFSEGDFTVEACNFFINEGTAPLFTKTDGKTYIADCHIDTFSTVGEIETSMIHPGAFYFYLFHFSTYKCDVKFIYGMSCPAQVADDCSVYECGFFKLNIAVPDFVLGSSSK